MSEENTTLEVSETSPIALYAKQCMDQFQGLSTNWNKQDKDEFKKAIEEIVFAFAGQGEDAAKTKFEGQYLPHFQVIATAKNAMAQFGGLKKEGGYGLNNLADHVEGMNCATASVTGQLFSLPIINKVPGVNALSIALNGLAQIDQTLLAATGGAATGQTFGSVANLIRGIATQAENMGIPVNTEDLQGKISELAKSEPAQQALEFMKNMKEKIADSDIPGALNNITNSVPKNIQDIINRSEIFLNLKNSIGNSPIGDTVLPKLEAMAKDFMTGKSDGKGSPAH